MILTVCPNPSVDTFLYLEKLETGGVNRLSGEKQFPGGKGVHVAMAIAELGHDVSLLGFWGGTRGARMLEEIGSLGVKCFGPKLNMGNRVCYTLKTNDNFSDTELLGPGPNVSKAELNAFYNQFETLLRNAEIVVFSGSWPKGAPNSAYLQMIDSVSKAGKKAIIDTSENYLHSLLNADVFGIHLNSDESEKITGKRDVFEQLSILSKRFHLVALTRGKEGLYLSLGNKVVFANVTLDKVYSAVGSGDCLTAGLAVGLEKKLVTEEIAKLGVACGAANCLREDLGMLYKNDVDSLLDKIETSKSLLE